VTEEEFWDHIRATRRRDPEAHAERLVNRLAKLSEAEILDFDHWWRVASGRAYFWDLWGAAYLINGGCSDDGFQYFRWWLILQGRAVYEAALANPDSLADVVDGEEEVEAEVYPAADAWFQATGTERDDAGYRAMHRAAEKRRPKKPRQRGMGRQWDFDDDAQVRKRLPRLAALYLEDEDDD
jgi:hypothetical protein